MRGLFVCITSCALACGSPNRVPLDDAGAVVLAMVDRGVVTSLEAVDDVSFSEGLVRIAPPGVDVFVLAYDRSVEALCLPRGPLQLVAAGEGQLLPAPRSVHKSEAGGPWRLEPPELPPILRSVHVRSACDRDPCTDFVGGAIPLPTDKRLRFIETLDETRALVGSSSVAYVVSRDGVQAALTSSSGAPLRSAWVRGDGVVWLGARSGTLFSTHRDRFGEAWAQEFLGADRSVSAIAGDPSGPELFVANDGGQLFYRSGEGEFEELVDLDHSAEPDLAWVSPGVALMTARLPTIQRAEDGEVENEPIDRRDASVTAVGDTPLGFVLGTGHGRFYRYDEAEARWLFVHDWEVHSVDAIVPFRSGFFAVGNFGRAHEFVPGHGFCDVVEAVSDDIPFAARVGEDIVFGGSDGDPTLLWWFGPRG